MTAYTSSGLGWTAGQNISSQLATFFNSTAQAGDSLHLAHRFQINRATTGQLTIPANFTLSAADGGGFDSLTVQTGSTLTQFTVSAGVLIENVTVRMVNGPNTGYGGNNPARGVDYMEHRFFSLGAANIEFRNCDLEGQISHWMQLNGNCSGFLSRGTKMVGGFWATYLLGDVFAPRWEDCYFADQVTDAIKTVMLNDKVASGWVGSRSDGVVKNVLRCQFVDCNRDGIDTTGGMRNWIIEDSFFSGCGVDIKHPLKQADDPVLASQTVWTALAGDGLPIYGCYNVVFNNVTFEGDRPTIMVLDTRATWISQVTAENFQRLLPQRIFYNDCHWYEADNTAAIDFISMKSADDITVTNLTRYANAQNDNIFDLRENSVAPWAPGWSPATGFTATGTTNSAATPDLGVGWYKIDPDAPIEGPGEPEDPPPVPILLQSTTINVTASGISPPSVTMAFAQTGYAAGVTLTLADLVADITQAGEPALEEGDLTLTLIVGGSPVSLPYVAVEGASMVARATWTHSTTTGTQTANSGAIVVVAAVALTAVVTAQATIEFTGAGLITHRYSSPSPYASVDVGFGPGEVRYNTANLLGGPISVIPARIKFTSGTATPGGVIGLPSVWDATAYGGIWVHNGATATLARKFQRNNVDIVGATGDTYTLVEADVGASVTMVETLTDDVGSTSRSTNALNVPDTENWGISVGDGTYTINGFPPVPLTPAWSISVGDGTYTINSFPGGS